MTGKPPAGGGRMNEAAWLAITLCLGPQVLNGSVALYPEERLLDLLNGVAAKQAEDRGRFLALSDVTIQHPGGEEERLPTVYINKMTIHLAATWRSDSGRGIGGSTGKKPYPFVEKLPVPVTVRLPVFSLTGSMHCATGQRAWHVLEERPMFLPLTNVKVRPLANGIWSNVPFVAVNREQIVSLQEEEIPLLHVAYDQP